MVLSAAVAIAPPPALAATTLAARCDGVKLRTKPTTTARTLRSLSAGAKVTAVAKVSGSRWSIRCAGSSSSGSSWWRITSINGRSVKSLYGVSYVYGATGLFKTAITPATLEAACGGRQPPDGPQDHRHAQAHPGGRHGREGVRHGDRRLLEGDLQRFRVVRCHLVPDHPHRRGVGEDAATASPTSTGRRACSARRPRSPTTRSPRRPRPRSRPPRPRRAPTPDADTRHRRRRRPPRPRRPPAPGPTTPRASTSATGRGPSTGPRSPRRASASRS